MGDEIGTSSNSPKDSVHSSMTWEWKRREVQPLTPTINLTFKSQKVKKIKETLETLGGAHLLEKFVVGQMGPLINWRGGKSFARVVHGIVSRQITLSEAPAHDLWFRISGKNIRLSPPEFALVTGLHFGESNFDPRVPRDPSQVDAYREFCFGKPTTVKDLMYTFSEMDVDINRHDLYLQVANVLLLYYFVLGYAETRKIESWVWVLVNDLDEWNRFPWGGYSYQALLHYFGLLANTILECNPKYHFSGPVWALEVWALEAIPDLAGCVAECVDDNAVPRCLRWRLGGNALEDAERKEYFEEFFSREHECRCTLMPRSHEAHSDYWVTVVSSATLGVHYVTPTNPVKDHTGSPILRRVVNRDKRGIKDNPRSKKKDVSDPEPPRRRSRLSITSELHAPHKAREQMTPPLADRDTEQRRLDSHKRFIEHLTDVAIEKFKTNVMPDVKNFFTDLFSSLRASPHRCNFPPIPSPQRNPIEVLVNHNVPDRNTTQKTMAGESDHDPACVETATIQPQCCEDAADVVAQTLCQFFTSLNSELGPHPFDTSEYTAGAPGSEKNDASGAHKSAGVRKRKPARPQRFIATDSNTVRR